MRFDFVLEKHPFSGTCVHSILQECFETVKYIAGVISEAISLAWKLSRPFLQKHAANLLSDTRYLSSKSTHEVNPRKYLISFFCDSPKLCLSDSQPLSSQTD